MTGIAGNFWVLFAANDAYMRDLELFVPDDCAISNTEAENEQALDLIGKYLKDRRASSSPVRPTHQASITKSSNADFADSRRSPAAYKEQHEAPSSGRSAEKGWPRPEPSLSDIGL